MFSENPFFSTLYGFDRVVDYADDQIDQKLRPSSFSIANRKEDRKKGIRELIWRVLVGNSRAADISNSVYTLYRAVQAKEENANVGSHHHTRRVLNHLRSKISGTDGRLLSVTNLLETHNPHTVQEQAANSLNIEFTKEERAELNEPTDDHMYVFGRESEPVRDPFQSWNSLYEKKHDAYISSIAKLDSEIKRFVEQSPTDTLEDSLIILTSDHGELFGEEGMAGHQTSLHPAGTHVPLFVRFPNSWDPDMNHISTPTSWTELTDATCAVLSGEVDTASGFVDVLKPDGQVVVAVDGPNWRIEPLKERFDSELVSSYLEQRKVATISNTKQVVYSSGWREQKVRKRIFELKTKTRTLLESNEDVQPPAEFRDWLIEQSGESRVAEDVSQRLENLGYT